MGRKPTQVASGKENIDKTRPNRSELLTFDRFDNLILSLDEEYLPQKEEQTKTVPLKTTFKESPSGAQRSPESSGVSKDPAPLWIISDPAQLGAHFAAAREVAGMTQEQVAELAGGKSLAPAIRRFEAGKGNPSFQTIVKYCSIVGLKLSVTK